MDHFICNPIFHIRIYHSECINNCNIHLPYDYYSCLLRYLKHYKNYEYWNVFMRIYVEITSFTHQCRANT